MNQPTRCSRRGFLLGTSALLGAGTAIVAGYSIRGKANQTPDVGPLVAQHKLFALGGRLEVSLPRDAGALAVASVSEAIAHVGRRMSLFDPASELSRLNAHAASGPVKLSNSLAGVVSAARALFADTRGAFDPTIGPLIDAWRFRSRPERPSKATLRNALDRVGFDRVRFDDQEVSFGREGMAIDLGGIAVGHAVDRAVASLHASGIRHGLINSTGDLRAVGPRPDGSPWLVGIKHPEGRNVFATLELSGARAMSTSGTYEKYAMIDGKRVSHILDPRSGESPDEVVSATVVAGTAIVADSLATACIVLGAKEALALLQRTPDTEGLLVVNRPGKGYGIEGTSGINPKMLEKV